MTIAVYIVAFLIFSVAMFTAGYFIWSVPEQEHSEALRVRLRGLRAASRNRTRRGPELLRKEHRGSFAFLGDLVTWVGVLRRLQEIIEQANLKYRAADVFGLSLLLAGASFGVFAVLGGDI